MFGKPLGRADDIDRAADCHELRATADMQMQDLSLSQTEGGGLFHDRSCCR
jgi:hypothetical protein